jgi:hypothetical protein
MHNTALDRTANIVDTEGDADRAAGQLYRYLLMSIPKPTSDKTPHTTHAITFNVFGKNGTFTSAIRAGTKNPIH